MSLFIHIAFLWRISHTVCVWESVYARAHVCVCVYTSTRVCFCECVRLCVASEGSWTRCWMHIHGSLVLVYISHIQVPFQSRETYTPLSKRPPTPGLGDELQKNLHRSLCVQLFHSYRSVVLVAFVDAFQIYNFLFACICLYVFSQTLYFHTHVYQVFAMRQKGYMHIHTFLSQISFIGHIYQSLSIYIGPFSICPLSIIAF